MRYLLDTHAFIWWDNQPEKLSSRVLMICEDSDNELFLSMAAMWEMQIKLQLGKLRLPLPLDRMIGTQIDKNGLQLLSIETRHIFQLSQLPDLHRDPFDRLMIAQSMIEGLSLLTSDLQIAAYPAATVW